MKKYFKDGKIIAEGMLFEKAIYDVSNNSISVTLDGNGTIHNYSIIGDKTYYNYDFGSLKFIIGGKELPYDTKKCVEMLGRMQKITYEAEDTTVVVKLFVSKRESCVFTRIDVTSKTPQRVEVGLLLPGALTESSESATDYSENKSGLHIASDKEFICVGANEQIVFDIAPTTSASIDLAYGFNNPEVKTLSKKAEFFENEITDEIKNIKLPALCKTELEKAQYYNTYFCALENYKEIGELRGFMAGCHYIAPARTYYRDSYFTVISMYNGETEKIRNEIVTLSKGISEDGSCPSAVISDFSPWWGEHFDSPSFLSIMAYDYVNNTGDFSVLEEKVQTGTVLDCCERVIKKHSLFCDDTGLIVKPGKYNDRDWADNVHRVGYVSYDNILFARALFCLSRLTKNDAEKSAAYEKQYEKVKNAINEILWDENLGYYVNFTGGERTETNLSVDTILAVIYGIAEGERAETMLSSCQKMLESRNHPELIPYGILSVYPLYSGIDTAYAKSARPYDYHNGGEWPYWSAMYAYALKMYGRDYKYALTTWFEYNIERNHFTPIEFYSPYCKDGSLLQAWSGASAFVYWDENSTFFENKI